MAKFHRIQSVMNRIQIIESRFKPPAPTLNPGVIPVDATLKMELGANLPHATDFTSGPNSLNALLNSMGSRSQIGNYSSDEAARKLVDMASKWDGKEFKPGQTARCADFVSTMVQEAGVAPQNFSHEVNCWELQKQGKKVDKKDLKPGDVVYFGYTYLPVDYTHVGIYVGNGKFVHRPTADKPVRIDSLETGYYAQKYSSARRLWQ
jgi:cell wall-associated NlpC family hydrolase